jgi:hypothetical protein
MVSGNLTNFTTSPNESLGHRHRGAGASGKSRAGEAGPEDGKGVPAHVTDEPAGAGVGLESRPRDRPEGEIGKHRQGEGNEFREDSSDRGHDERMLTHRGMGLPPTRPRSDAG